MEYFSTGDGWEQRTSMYNYWVSGHVLCSPKHQRINLPKNYTKCFQKLKDTLTQLSLKNISYLKYTFYVHFKLLLKKNPDK